MSNPRRRTDDDQFDERGIVRDGGVVRVPLYLRDGITPNPDLTPTQRSVAQHARRFADGRQRLHDGRGHAPGNRPGFVFDTIDRATVDAVEQARADYQDDLVNAWRGGDSAPLPTMDAEQAREAYENDLTSAWQHRDDDVARSTNFIGARAGDLCTVRQGGAYGAEGSPGHLQMVGGELVCVADAGASRDAQPTTDARQRALDEYDEWAANAWRTPT
jgi:hypothetical protein